MLANAVSKLGATTLLYIFIASLSGGILTIIVPPFYGLDEAAHINRTQQISRGEIFAIKRGNSTGGFVRESLAEVESRATIQRKQKGSEANRGLVDYAYGTPFEGPDVWVGFPGSATYSPVAYLSALPGFCAARILDLSVGHTLLLTRISSLIFFVAIVAYSIWVLKRFRLRWLIVTIALWPGVVFQSAVVGADSLSIALSLLIFAIFAKAILARSLTGLELGAASIAAILLPLVKFNYIFVSAVLLFVPKVALKEVLVDKPVTAFKIGIISASSLLLGAWLFVMKDYGSAINHEANFVGQAKLVLSHPWVVFTTTARTLAANGTNITSDYLNSMVGRLGYNMINIPIFTVFTSWLIALGAGLYSRVEMLKGKTEFIQASSLSILGVISVFMTLYLIFTPVGAEMIGGIQGRYFLPFVPFLIVLTSVLIPVEVKAKRGNFSIIAFGILTTNLIITCGYYYYLTFIGLKV